jgi:hypothetical protein
MNIHIYGIEQFASVTNWFQSSMTILLLAIFTFVVSYLFYKLNFTRHNDETSAVHHYMSNIGLFAGYGVILFWVSRFVLQLDLIWSAILTLVFYSVLLYVLTITMIIMRRNKIKRWVIEKANFINDNPRMKWKQDNDNPLYKIRSKCIEDGHKYLDWLLKDIDGNKLETDKEGDLATVPYAGERPIDISKYQKINIWKDENMKREE